MNKIIRPDGWVVIKLTDTYKDNEPPIYKVFASWRGGYLDGDSWKINSGIKSVIKDGDKFIFHGYSGSEYHCHKNYYGHCTSYADSVLSDIINNAGKHGFSIIQLPHDFDFNQINNE